MNPRYLGLIGKIDWSIDNISQLQGRFGAVENAFQHKILPLFDHYTSVGNVGTDETDLYSDTIVGGTLATDGDKLEFMYSGIMTGGAADSIIRVYFGGGVSPIYQSGQQGGGHDWTVTGYIIRVSSSVVRYSINLYGANVPTVSPAINSDEKTGLTLSDGNILKISVECTTPATPNDSAIAVLGSVKWISHA